MDRRGFLGAILAAAAAPAIVRADSLMRIVPRETTLLIPTLVQMIYPPHPEGTIAWLSNRMIVFARDGVILVSSAEDSRRWAKARAPHGARVLYG